MEAAFEESVQPSLIGEADLVRLRNEIAELGVVEAKFTAHIGVSVLEDLELAEADEAFKLLALKRMKMQELADRKAGTPAELAIPAEQTVPVELLAPAVQVVAEKVTAPESSNGTISAEQLKIVEDLMTKAAFRFRSKWVLFAQDNALEVLPYGLKE